MRILCDWVFFKVLKSILHANIHGFIFWPTAIFNILVMYRSYQFSLFQVKSCNSKIFISWHKTRAKMYFTYQCNRILDCLTFCKAQVDSSRRVSIWCNLSKIQKSKAPPQPIQSHWGSSFQLSALDNLSIYSGHFIFVEF